MFNNSNPLSQLSLLIAMMVYPKQVSSPSSLNNLSTYKIDFLLDK